MTQPLKRRSDFQNLAGRVFHKLTVLSFVRTHANGHSIWLCRCECGTTVERMSKKLKDGSQKSCGCLGRQRIGNITHGHTVKRTQSSEYAAYRSAKLRCENPALKNFPDYGGRGIKFKFRSFEEFLAELGPKPTRRHSLDRIDNNGHYQPGNVRWATGHTQRRNTRGNLRIKAFGETKTAAEWAERIGTASSVIANRVRMYGWCPECSVSIQPRCGSCIHK